MQITDILISSITISFCLIFALFTFLKFKENKSAHLKYLTFFFLSSAVYYAIFLFYLQNDFNSLLLLFPLSLPVFLAIIPSFYTFLLSMTKPKVKAKKILIHYSPSILFLLLLIPYYFFPSEIKTGFLNGFDLLDEQKTFFVNLVHYSYLAGVLFAIHIQLVVYLILFFFILKNFKIEIENRFSNTDNISLEWTFYFITFLVTLILLLDFSEVIGVKESILSRIIFNFLSVAIFIFLFFKGTQHKYIYQVSKDEFKEEVLVENIIEETTGNEIVNSEQKKYQSSWLKEQEKQRIINQIDNLISKSNVFYDKDLSIESLAKKLNTNTSYLSQVINEHYKMNFFNFVNNLRVKQAAKLLSDSEFEKYTIEAIANISGFGSRTSFYEAFKKIYGFTPSQFKKSLNKAV